MAYQSKNRFIERLEEKNIPVTWHFLLMGFMGPGVLPNQLSSDEIVNYALKKEMEGPSNKIIENIAYSDVDDRTIIEKNLRILSSEEDQENKLSDLKKWELLLLEDHFEDLSEDPIKGLTSLTSFWSQFDFPEDCPHEVQSRGNTTSPERYYTQEHYHQLIKKHKQWMEQTEQQLRYYTF
ncbi:MAG: DUF2247 family protein [Alphaproteobacteria bacterium]|nr:DUF2247 family protein [Alphaproteobacteria bacterium]